jgi:hypothetical protein
MFAEAGDQDHVKIAQKVASQLEGRFFFKQFSEKAVLWIGDVLMPIRLRTWV